jgi:uncharacterized protein YdhG (YjbR/CyaY superfamily)
MAAKKSVQKDDGFSSEERAAMKERVRETKKKSSGKADDARDVLDKIAEMEPGDRAMAERLHGLIQESAPSLSPKTWYGMPAYADASGKVVCFFQAALKFKSRYATLGFSDQARLDNGAMWPSAFALKELTPEAERTIAALVKRAAG